MIDDLKLKELLEDNNLTFPRRIREDLKKHTEYKELVEILSILKKLNIPSSLIERHPDILYTSSNDIRENYRIIKYNKLYNYTQEELLEILSKNNEDIRNTHTYLYKKYGNEEINNNISILTRSVQRIKSIERYEQVLLPNVMFSAITSKLNETEINDVITTCIRNNIQITSNVFKRTSSEIRNLIKICKENAILPIDSIFTKTPKELEEIIKIIKRMKFPFVSELLYCPMEKIELLFSSFTDNKINVTKVLEKTNVVNTKNVLEICAKYNLNIDHNTILLDSEKMLKVIELCNNYNVKVTSSMFKRELEEIEDIIKYCREKDLIIRDTYFERTKKEIEDIHTNCTMSLKRDDLTYKRNIKEMIDIMVFCKTNNMKFSTIMFNNNLDEIQEIIDTCNKRHIRLSNEVFKTDHRSLDRIISILKQQPLIVPFTPLACNRTPYEVQRIKEIAIENKIHIIPEMFLRTPYEIERILKLTKNKIHPKYFQYPLSKLVEILEFCNNKGIKISPSMLDRTTGEIEDILEICNNKNIEIMDPAYQRKPKEIEEIIRYCEDKKLQVSSDCFRKNPIQFKEAVEVCQKLNIPPVGEVFKRTPEEINAISKIYGKILKQDPINNSFATTPEEVEKIINLLLNNNIGINGIVFKKKENDLKETIEFIKKKYGEDYLLPQIIIYDKDQIDRVFSYCSGRGCMDVIKTCPAILKLTIAEIVERTSYIASIGEEFIEDNKFNQVLLWSKKKYQEMKEKQEETNKRI